ncbi:UrcA family protein [Sphingobium fuliginis]|jgi:UrcA family protein|uniref:UrcA family protein n=2 Tax=Sphingobium TaxID=165695 RepID=UPI0037C67E82
MMKIGLMCLAAFAFATPAIAGTAGGNPFAQDTAILDLKGLDLSTASGQQSLAIRMDQAARAVCGDHLAGVHLALESQARDCRTAVAADIRAQIEARLAKAGDKSPVQMASAR